MVIQQTKMGKSFLYRHYFGKMSAKTAFIFMLSNVLSEGHIEDIKTEFIKGKYVSTSHTTLQSYSKIECVKKCYEEGKKGNCNVAGYDKSTKSCHLSLDMDTDVVDAAVEASGVYIFPQGVFIFNPFEKNISVSIMIHFLNEVLLTLLL